MNTKNETITPLDKHLDAILRAAGTALRHYSTQKTVGAMCAALSAAVADLAPVSAAPQPLAAQPVAGWWKAFSHRTAVEQGSTFAAEDALDMGWRALCFLDDAQAALAAKDARYAELYHYHEACADVARLAEKRDAALAQLVEPKAGAQAGPVLLTDEEIKEAVCGESASFWNLHALWIVAIARKVEAAVHTANQAPTKAAGQEGGAS